MRLGFILFITLNSYYPVHFKFLQGLTSVQLWREGCSQLVSKHFSLKKIKKNPVIPFSWLMNPCPEDDGL